MKKKLVGTACDFRNLCIQIATVLAVITFIGLIIAIVSSIWALFIAPLCLTIFFFFDALLWHIKHINETIKIQEQIKYEQEQLQKKSTKNQEIFANRLIEFYKKHNFKMSKKQIISEINSFEGDNEELMHYMIKKIPSNIPTISDFIEGIDINIHEILDYICFKYIKGFDNAARTIIENGGHICWDDDVLEKETPKEVFKFRELVENHIKTLYLSIDNNYIQKIYNQQYSEYNNDKSLFRLNYERIALSFVYSTLEKKHLNFNTEEFNEINDRLDTFADLNYYSRKK